MYCTFQVSYYTWSMNTEPVTWLEKNFSGYMVNTPLSDELADEIDQVQRAFHAEFPSGIYYMPRQSLHVTLYDWIAPLYAYAGKDKEALYSSIHDSYHAATLGAVATTPPFTVHFRSVVVSPTTIYIRGYDNGEFNTMRETFVDNVELIDDTKRPPTIIHSSIARFTRALPLPALEAFAQTLDLSHYEDINGFRLVHSTREPMLEFDEVHHYPLRDAA